MVSRLRMIGGIFGLGAVVVLGLGALARTSLPRLDGSVAAPGLAQPATLGRDRWGIAHIDAADAAGAAYALGYAHAQDRLWQMEFQRRLAQGRLAEIFGARALEADLVFRALDLAGHSARALARLRPETRARLDAYVAGVNAGIAAYRVALPPEFLLLAHGMEPWTAADSVLALKFMAVGLSTNAFSEIARARLMPLIGPRGVEDLFQPSPGQTPPPLPDPADKRADALTPALKALAALPWPATQTASNNWVVSGTRTDTGKPYLANDPHLGLSLPSVFYFARLATPRATMIGATLPGTPLVILGHNGKAAWGFTNAGPDVQDLYLETIDPADPNRYLTPDGSAPFETRVETFKVRFGADRTETLRATRHGPVLPVGRERVGDLVGGDRVLALAWTALTDDDRTLDAGVGVTEVETYAGFKEALRDFVAPMQAMVFADVAGEIGLMAPGRVPMRDPANAIMGRLPSPGADALYDWRGFLPFDDLPSLVDPARGWIGTANAQFTEPGYKPHLTFDFDAPDRRDRIATLIEARTVHDLSSMIAMQRDVHSPMADRFLPEFLAASPPDEIGAALAAWDHEMVADRPEPLIFTAWLRAFTQTLLEARLKGDAGLALTVRSLFLAKTLSDPEVTARWCAPAPRACANEIAAARETALADLRRQFGADWRQWRWGAAHPAVFDHRPFGAVPYLRALFSVEAPSAGGADTLFRGMHAIGGARPFANIHASTFRAVYDLADLDRSVFVNAGGQSGNPLSPHYADMVALWTQGAYVTIPGDPAKAAAIVQHRLTLAPAP